MKSVMKISFHIRFCSFILNLLMEVNVLDIPSDLEMTELIGERLFDVWQSLCNAIDEIYDVSYAWSDGGKKWTYEKKLRKGGKTLCALYAKKDLIGFMIIFGKDERAKVEEIRGELSDKVLKEYDSAEIYHDGKWVMFTPDDRSKFDDYMKLLSIKRKPNKK